MSFLPVMKNGTKKKPRNLFGAGLKEKLCKRSASYTLGIRHSFQLDHIASKSGTSEAFRFCAFYITFHFYNNKGLKRFYQVFYFPSKFFYTCRCSKCR